MRGDRIEIHEIGDVGAARRCSVYVGETEHRVVLSGIKANAIRAIHLDHSTEAVRRHDFRYDTPDLAHRQAPGGF